MITSFFKAKKRGSSATRKGSAAKKIKKEEPGKENNAVTRENQSSRKSRRVHNKTKTPKYPVGKTFVKKVRSVQMLYMLLSFQTIVLDADVHVDFEFLF